KVSTGFEDYQFIHQALPEIDLDSVDLSTSLFGKKLKAPLIISAMVGGIEEARRINHNLAQAIQALGAGVAGMATPLLKTVNESAESVIVALREIIEGLRISMFCIGVSCLTKLKNSPLLKKEMRS
ncbi:MAG: alpha-hydroxy-acid oxidizing protein, partial [Syntrophales bacterium]|nr:alpha-hydroxy-acid oxidizing protein [Syntrophales bacterium]